MELSSGSYKNQQTPAGNRFTSLPRPDLVPFPEKRSVRGREGVGVLFFILISRIHIYPGTLL